MSSEDNGLEFLEFSPDEGGDGKPPMHVATGTGSGGDGFGIGDVVLCEIESKASNGYKLKLEDKQGFIETSINFKIGDTVAFEVHQYIDDVVHLSIKRQALDYEPNTGNVIFRRATDLMIPPLKVSDIVALSGGKAAIAELKRFFKGKSGILKAANERKRSRMAALILNGKFVGSFFHAKEQQDTYPTDGSLEFLAKDLYEDDTKMQMYIMPDFFILPFSSLFLGYPVKRDDDYTALEYFEFVLDWFEKEKSTACLAASFSNGRGMCLAFIFNGYYIGCFDIESQRINLLRRDFEDLISRDSETLLDLSVYPDDMEVEGSEFGYSFDKYFG